MKSFLLTTSAACAIVFTSCGKKVDTGVNKDNLGPQEAAENWKKDLTDGRVASLWDSLPESYQTDVEGLVHDFGSKVDSELYNESFKTAKAAAGFFKSKKTIILELAKESAPPSKKEEVATAEANYDSFVGLLNAIVESDVSQAEGLAKLDIAKFCGDIQPHTKSIVELAAIADKNNEFSKIKNASIKVLSEDGDNAELEISAEDGKTKKVKVVKVDDRWVPADLAKDWDAKIKEAKEKIGKIEKLSAVEKEKALSVMRIVQAAIKDLETANTKEELEAKAQKAMGDVMGGLMGQ